jgi:hypothetical protein
MNGILSDQLAPYLDLFGGEIKSHFKGTIIRIPLRILEAQEQSRLDRVIGQVWTIGQIQAMFRTWVEDATSWHSQHRPVLCHNSNDINKCKALDGIDAPKCDEEDKEKCVLSRDMEQ